MKDLTDEVGSALVEPAVELVRHWLRDGEAALAAAERTATTRLHRLTADPASVAFTMGFCDRVLRPESDRVAAEQLRQVVAGGAPAFLSPADRVLLRTGAALSRLLPGAVMPLARRRLRHLVGSLVLDRADPELSRQLDQLRAGGFRVNANLLGEFVLGDEEAARRRDATLALLQRPDVDYVSVKASSVASHLNLWAYDHTVERVRDGLRPLLRAAAASNPPKFVNIDMEEYRDLRLTIDAFTGLLDEPELRRVEAGIVLQAYLPDAFAALQELVAWAVRRTSSGGAGIKIRIVKGANLAMEQVEAALHGWCPAPYATKAETDANYKRLLDWAMTPERLTAVRLGVASHNLFDVAWAHLLAQHRGVTDRVEFEMLQGMAPGLARTVQAASGGLLLYTPVVAAADFETALAYLFRRLEENSSGDNFLRHLFELRDDPARFAEQEERFATAVAERWSVSSHPRRGPGTRPAPTGPGSFRNAADSDPTDTERRAAVLAAVADPPVITLPPEPPDTAAVDAIVTRAQAAQRQWASRPASSRRDLLHRAADELTARRPALLAVMAHEAGKTVGEGDGEVSEAIDFARYYAEGIAGLDGYDGSRFEPLGVVAVIPPWNFPLSIPAGGVFAALAAGNAVILKPAPQTPRTAVALAEACWAAGIPSDVLQLLRGPDAVIGEHLVAHRDLDGIILTGAFETAELFSRLAPDTALFAETSGKNAIVVLPDADLDLAVADVVASAFGHAGQKCSAASLVICVGDVGRSDRFRRQLLDATRSLPVAPAWRPEALMGPLVEPPSPKLRRALTTLETGQRWLLEPRPLDESGILWSPGILDGVVAGSWFHQTECFGPVLGLMRAADLDEALTVQNAVPFGLTGGLHTLDPAHVEHWLSRVEVGNAYVNRAITGAVVQRQPFGGWKRSVVGPGAKAGGPNYLGQLGRWSTEAEPTRGAEPTPAVRELLEQFAGTLDHDDRRRLEAAARSDAYWWMQHFSVEHDPSGLFCESNVFRYRRVPVVHVRACGEAGRWELARVVVAVAATGSALRLSLDLDHWGRLPGGVEAHRESDAGFGEVLAAQPPDRVRLLGGPGTTGDRGSRPVSVPAGTSVDRRAVVADGRIELARYLREQTVSRTLHRFGNLVPSGGPRAGRLR